MALTPGAKELWSQIRDKNCKLCPLHKEAQTVCLIGDGPVPADVMIVGEAPGFREDEVSRPFSGKSGRLLDETLEKFGLDRRSAFITNVNKCRPPENRTPNKTEQKACRPYLDKEIEAVNPKFILTLGNTALSVVRKSGIMKHRGSVNQLGDIQVFSTVHPAAVLRNPRYAQLFDSDIAAFARLVKGQDGAKPPRTFLVQDKQTLAKACQAILKSTAVAYDVETTGFDEVDDVVVTVGIAVKPGLAFVIPIHHPESKFTNPDKVFRVIGNALASTPAKLIAHNAKFDDKWFLQRGVPLYADFDTMIAAHIVNENWFKSLKVLATMILGVDAWANVDLAKGGAQREPLKRLARYNGKDADYTLRLYTRFREDLLREANERSARLFVKLLMPASRTLTDVERHGIWIDQERLAERRIELTKRIEKADKKLVKLVGYQANWNSPQQVARILFEEIKLPLIEVTKTGAASTKEAVLLRLRDRHPVAQALLDYREVFKQDSTYFKSWAENLREDGRLHANYKITGTVTGRLSSGKEEGNRARGLNVQQVPRDPFLRAVFGAPAGWKFIEADFSQVELRLVAHYSQDPTMMRLFLQNQDIHMDMAVKLTGKPAHAVTKEERKKAKGVNFGYAYGMGWRHYIEYAFDSYDLVVTEEEARESRETYFRTFSALPGWHERQRRLARLYGRVQSSIGRVRHLPDIDSDDEKVRQEAERQAINSPVQSLGSDLMLLAMNTLHEIMSPDEAAIVGTVHDSILFEVREDVVDKWVPIIRQTMEHPPLKKKFGVDLTVPLKADITVGTHWSEGQSV